MDSVKAIGNSAASYLPSIADVFLGETDDKQVRDPTVWNQLLLALVIIVVFLIVYKIIQSIIQQIQSYEEGSPYLVENTKDAKKTLVLYQNPIEHGDSDNLKPLRRSLNEKDGLEFTYSWWMFIEDYEYKKGSWKHVFHKGNADSWPSRAPGVWLHPTSNSMYVYMNSYNEIQNEVEIDNIPIGKWFHVALSVTQSHMNIYINGFLKKRKALNGIAKQNFGDVYINAFGGFAGYISRMRYYDYATPLSQVQVDVETGPNMELPYSSQQKPPYLTPYWRVNNQ